MELSLLLVLCIHSESFFREVYKTKQLSILVMSRYVDVSKYLALGVYCDCYFISGPLRKKAKNMFKLIEMSPPCFSVYGMWTMDVYLLLHIFNIITTLIVTILQLTF
ncbi:uncharacterized protein [Choristoneura fumiferana]|uniref:uncharacterized protein n=1 Tax=Choristoneura fumiferana TaxID=7141 RepID=UPI003D15764F